MKCIVRMQFGSHVYGTNIATSDQDFKAVHLPTEREIILGTAQESINVNTRKNHGLGVRNSAADIDFESFSLKKFMKLLYDGQTVALTMLFTPKKYWSESSAIWESIVANKKLWLHSGITAYAGYCRSQANKYGVKGSRIASVKEAIRLLQQFPPNDKLSAHWLPLTAPLLKLEHTELLKDDHGNAMFSVCDRKVQEHITIAQALKIYQRVFEEYGKRALQAETEQGVDWKALMHAVRVAGEAKELLLTGHITYPRPEAALLLDIRQGKRKYAEVVEIIEEGLTSLEGAQRISILRSVPLREIFDDFVFKTYKERVRFRCEALFRKRTGEETVIYADFETLEDAKLWCQTQRRFKSFAKTWIDGEEYEW